MPAIKSYQKDGYLHEPYRFFHLRDNIGQEKDYHFHDFNKLVFLLSGKVDYFIEDTVCHMEPGDVVLVRHHTIHRVEIDTNVIYDRIILYLDPVSMTSENTENSLEYCFDQSDHTGIYHLQPDPEEQTVLASLLHSLENAVSDQNYAADILQKSYLLQLLVQINRLTLKMPADTVPAAVESSLAPVLSFINEHLTEELSIDDLASAAHLSKYHFMRLFKTEIGFTAAAYIKRKRVQRAAQLIRSGMSAADAALECGYRDYSSFHRAFRDIFSLSPGSLKKGKQQPHSG